MRWKHSSLAALLAILVALVGSLSHAQCNRGSRGGPPSGIPTGTQNAYQPFAARNAQQYALAQQQRNLAQQRYQQMHIARQRQRLEQRRLSENPADAVDSTQTFGSDEFKQMLESGSGLATDRKQQLRDRKAEQALNRGARSEQLGKLASAEKLYRRVIQIAGDSSELGRQAESALAAITQRRTENRVTSTQLTHMVSLP